MTDHPGFEKKPFVKKYLNSNEDIIIIRLNDEERSMLKEFKDLLRIDGDSTALKKSLEISHNVLHSLFGKKLMQYLCSARRLRPPRN